MPLLVISYSSLYILNTLCSEKAVATHSSILAWKIPWTEEPGRLQSMGSLRVRHDRLPFHFSLSCIGEGNGNPLQCSCLENPRDGGAGWAAIYGVAQSQTRLTRLSSNSSSSSNTLCYKHSSCCFSNTNTNLPWSFSYSYYYLDLFKKFSLKYS